MLVCMDLIIDWQHKWIIHIETWIRLIENTLNAIVFLQWPRENAESCEKTYINFEKMESYRLTAKTRCIACLDCLHCVFTVFIHVLTPNRIRSIESTLLSSFTRSFVVLAWLVARRAAQCAWCEDGSLVRQRSCLTKLCYAASRFKFALPLSCSSIAAVHEK